MFLGTHEPRLDEKGRLILPAKFREDLSAGLKGKVQAIANGQRPVKPAKKGFKERMDNRWDDRGRDSQD